MAGSRWWLIVMLALWFGYCMVLPLLLDCCIGGLAALQEVDGC